MKNHHKELSTLIQSGLVPADSIEEALHISQTTPSNSAWQSFISNMLLWLGALALAGSALFFIAFNWDDLGRFSKFGLIQLLVAASVFTYWKTSAQNPLLSKVSLLMASIFLGVLLAYFGQTYQTGADTWQLFLTWCILILPWTILSRFSAQWILWLALLNLSAVLYFQTFRSTFGFILFSENMTLWALVIINGTALIIWEFLENKWQWLAENWAMRVVAVASGAPLTLLVIDSIFGRQHNLISGLVWSIAMVAVYIVYRRLKPDLFMLAMACLSGISVIISLAAKLLFDSISDGIGTFLLLALLVILLGGASAVWLKNTHKTLLTMTRSKL